MGELVLRLCLGISRIFSNLKKIFCTKKIEDIYKMVNKIGKLKPHINMTTKSPSHKKIIVSMSNENINKFMIFSSEYVANLNCTLKDIRSDIFIDFIYFDHYGLIVTSNKVTFPSDLNMVENYMKHNKTSTL